MPATLLVPSSASSRVAHSVATPLLKLYLRTSGQRNAIARVLVRAGAEHPAAGQGDLFLGQGVGARGPSESRVAP